MNEGDAQKVRDIVVKVLKDGDGGINLNRWHPPHENPSVPPQAGGVAQKVELLAKAGGINTQPPDASFWPVVIEHLWTLARIGAIALLPQDPPVVGGMLPEGQKRLPSFVVTELGRKLFNEPDYSPHDWPKYKAATLVRVTSPDEIVLVHLHEAVMARQGTLYRSSLVMLGCACEQLILLLARAILDASLPSGKLADLLSASRPIAISKIFREVRSALMAPAARLPSKLSDSIDTKLSPIFEYARGLRNSHGHPTGTLVTAEEADSGLRLFPGFYALVDELIRHLRSLAAPPTGGA